jgi:hypothetical protein
VLLGSWALGHLGSWALGLFGTWALGQLGSWALRLFGTLKMVSQSSICWYFINIWKTVLFYQFEL